MSDSIRVFLHTSGSSTSVSDQRKKEDPSRIPKRDDKKESALERSIFNYHQVSKHHPDRRSNKPRPREWANQPKPFREFEGAPIYNLRLIDLSCSSIAFDEAFSDSTQPSEVNLASISQLFQDSLGLSSWKSSGTSKRPKRCNPSSGNLHPTEGYLIAPAIQGLADTGGVYHYRPKEHALELRTRVPNELVINALSHKSTKNHGIFIGLSSIHWREVWKYGDRAFRYCELDIGHAIETITIAASNLGWSTHVIDDVLSFHDLAALLGLKSQSSRASHEEPACLLFIHPRDETDSDALFDAHPLKQLITYLDRDEQEWIGRANRLGHGEVRWESVEIASKTSRKQDSISLQILKSWSNFTSLYTDQSPSPLLRPIIHQRRSGTDYDSNSKMPLESFYNILRSVQSPLASISWEPQVHLVIFVHGIENLTSGLYILVRNPDHLEELRTNMDRRFDWTRPRNCPADLHLFKLKHDNEARSLAETASNQEKAGEGCCCVAMIARFENTVKEKGAWFYRRLLWECGMIGQRLYISAEATNGHFRGTGLGYFHDDIMHSMIGLSNSTYQSLYHFTIGFPIIDSRTTYLDPYHHLPNRSMS